jgi:hypothetical protein
MFATFTRAGMRNDFYRSTDGGITWVHLAKGLPQPARFGRTSLAMAAANPKVIYAIAADHASGSKDWVYFAPPTAETRGHRCRACRRGARRQPGRSPCCTPRCLHGKASKKITGYLGSSGRHCDATHFGGHRVGNRINKVRRHIGGYISERNPESRAPSFRAHTWR